MQHMSVQQHCSMSAYDCVAHQRIAIKKCKLKQSWLPHGGRTWATLVGALPCSPALDDGCMLMQLEGRLHLHFFARQ